MSKRTGGRPPTSVLIAVLGISFLCLSAPPAEATSIVGIRTPTQVVIAADSMGTAQGSRVETAGPVCKIFTLKDAVFAVGGLVKGIPSGFDAEKLTAESLRRHDRLADAATGLAERLTEELGSYLERLKRGNPSLYAKSLEGGDGNATSILLAAYEGDRPVAIGLGFRASEEPGGRVRITATRVACPGDCPNGVMYFFLGERRPIERYLAEHGEDRLFPPSSGAPFMVQLVIDGESKRVGPPIDVVAIDRQGVSWLARKEGCGGAPAP